MGEGSSSIDAKLCVNGKSPARKTGRPKHLKRRSLHCSGGGDSTPRIQSPTTDNKPAEKEKEMAASFLQYCAMCEKQIMTPCNSLLYCSDACRRKDSAKPLSASSIASPLSTPSSPHPVTTPLPIRISSASPPPGYDAPVPRIPVDMHDAKSDLDPTEWKPKSQRRSESEAVRYLSRFHQTMNPSASASAPASETEQHQHVRQQQPPSEQRPAALRHRSTLSMSTSMSTNTPSLGNTPTTTASSFDSIYYDFNLRPLPLRQNPMYSTSAGTYRGIDLVTPHVPPPPVDLDAVAGPNSVAADSIDFWGKKPVVTGSTPQEKGLGALFGKDR